MIKDKKAYDASMRSGGKRDMGGSYIFLPPFSLSFSCFQLPKEETSGKILHVTFLLGDSWRGDTFVCPTDEGGGRIPLTRISFAGYSLLLFIN